MEEGPVATAQALWLGWSPSYLRARLPRSSSVPGPDEPLMGCWHPQGCSSPGLRRVGSTPSAYSHRLPPATRVQTCGAPAPRAGLEDGAGPGRGLGGVGRPPRRRRAAHSQRWEPPPPQPPPPGPGLRRVVGECDVTAARPSGARGTRGTRGTRRPKALRAPVPEAEPQAPGGSGRPHPPPGPAPSQALLREADAGRVREARWQGEAPPGPLDRPDGTLRPRGPGTRSLDTLLIVPGHGRLPSARSRPRPRASGRAIGRAGRGRRR